MPTLFTVEGFRFFFYSNDHEPMHVHVQHADGEASFVLVGDVVLRDSQGMKMQELRRAEELIRAHRTEIEEKWNAFFG